jgi:hypothetical protein
VLDFSTGADNDGGADDCDTSGGSTTCQVPAGANFSVTGYLNNTDSIGPYDAVQVVWQYQGVTFTPNGALNPKVVWPDCALVGSSSSATYVSGGCSIGVAAPGSTYIGPVVEATFVCSADGTVSMVHSLADTTIYDPDGQGYYEASPDETLTIDCVDPAPHPTDSDGDGCPDMNEAQPSPMAGGQRNFLNEWDYFNPTGDGLNRVDDIVAVLSQYFDDDADANPGLPPYEPGYNPDTDRTLVGPQAWNLGPPNGLQRIDDIVNALNHYFHDCG